MKELRRFTPKGQNVNQNAPRSGARNIARGTRFLRTPGKNTGSTSAPRTGCEESSTPLQGAFPGFGHTPGVRKRLVPLDNVPAPLLGE
jgi:hypothetical protein